jgi:hypothetical protein
MAAGVLAGKNVIIDEKSLFYRNLSGVGRSNQSCTRAQTKIVQI